ncbi:MAG: hypothetical protein KatS3mg015_2504 [Fimbriimonadales bacterium]|nr:MAG: hypothetical protein KatS3mg015_2504 [Fimbriimonadales bacterium]
MLPMYRRRQGGTQMLYVSAIRREARDADGRVLPSVWFDENCVEVLTDDGPMIITVADPIVQLVRGAEDAENAAEDA